MSADLTQTARLLVSDFLTTVRAPMLSRRFQQAVTTATGPVKVNVGAGTVVLPGWINTDVLWRSGMYLDLTKPWPVLPGSIDRIYGDNVIEHFSLEVARDVLRHCYSALRPGGAVRFATPDLERTARAYLEDPALTAAHLDRHRRHGYPAEHPADMLRVTYAYHGHHEGYIFDWERSFLRTHRRRVQRGPPLRDRRERRSRLPRPRDTRRANGGGYRTDRRGSKERVITDGWPEGDW